MNLTKRLFIIFFVTIACAGCDQGTKSLATDFLPKNQMTSYMYDIFRVGYTENTGAILGLGSQWPEGIRFAVFTVISSVMLIGLFIYMLSVRISLVSSIGLALIFSGGASNLYDRIVNDGAVVDFLNVGFGIFRTGIFNVADMAIMLGAALILYSQYLISDEIETAGQPIHPK